MSTPITEVRPEFTVSNWSVTPYALKETEAGPRLSLSFTLRETLLHGEKRLQLRGNALYEQRGSGVYDSPASSELYAIVRNFIRNNGYLSLLWTFE